MLRIIGNLPALRTRKLDTETNLTIARRLIKAVDENDLIGGININGRFYGSRYFLENIGLQEAARFVEEKFNPISRDLSVDYQVFAGRGKERHYFDFEHGRYISKPVDEGSPVIVSSVDVTIDYLVRT